MLEARRYRRAAEHLPSRLAPRRAIASAARRCRPSLRRVVAGRARGASTTPTRLGAAIGGAAARAAAARACATSRSRASRVAERLAHLRALLRRGVVSFDEAVARRRPRDGRRDAVRAARALQAGRGDVDAGRAVRRHRDRAARAGRPARTARRVRERAGARIARGAAVPLARAGGASPTWPRPRAAERRGRSRPRWPSSREACAPGRRALVLRELAGGWTLATDARGRGRPRGGCSPSRARRR